MGRRDFVFKWLFYALTALGFVLVQVFGLVHIRIWGVHPFLFPVLVSTVAALESAHESAVFALATGAVLDVTMPGVIPCFYTVAFLVVFLLARVLSAKVLSQPFFCCMLCGVLSIVCTDLLQMLFLNSSVSFSVRAALLLMGKELLLTLPLMPLIYLRTARSGASSTRNKGPCIRRKGGAFPMKNPIPIAPGSSFCWAF